MEPVKFSLRRLSVTVARGRQCGSCVVLPLPRSPRSLNPGKRYYSELNSGGSKLQTSDEAQQESDSEHHQAFPLTGYYKLILDNPLTPSTHPAYHPSQPQTKPKAAKSPSSTKKDIYPAADKKQFQRQAELEKEERKELESRARIVFGSRLTGPQRREALNQKAEYIAGILVPPKPEEPDNCCMSGCVNCVWDLYREDMEYWAAARMKAQEAARKQSITADTISAEEDSGRFIGEDMLSDSYKDIPVGIRAFMETEKRLKQKRAQEEAVSS